MDIELKDQDLSFAQIAQVKLMRKKSRYGWDFMVGEHDKHLMLSKWKEGSEPYYSGQWRMYTWMSTIHLTSAKRI